MRSVYKLLLIIFYDALSNRPRILIPRRPHTPTISIENHTLHTPFLTSPHGNGHTSTALLFPANPTGQPWALRWWFFGNTGTVDEGGVDGAEFHAGRGGVWHAGAVYEGCVYWAELGAWQLCCGWDEWGRWGREEVVGDASAVDWDGALEADDMAEVWLGVWGD
jgi:hypothetical protein